MAVKHFMLLSNGAFSGGNNDAISLSAILTFNWNDYGIMFYVVFEKCYFKRKKKIILFLLLNTHELFPKNVWINLFLMLKYFASKNST